MELAADAVVGAGKTFQACVDAVSLDGERWPVAVHLYYAGAGKWVVETHLGELSTVFTEATGAFRVTNRAAPFDRC
jgi:hypothetical protein